MHEVLEKVGANKKLVLVGHSSSGMHVRLFAHRYPKQVSPASAAPSMPARAWGRHADQSNPTAGRGASAGGRGQRTAAGASGGLFGLQLVPAGPGASLSKHHPRRRAIPAATRVSSPATGGGARNVRTGSSTGPSQTERRYLCLGCVLTRKACPVLARQQSARSSACPALPRPEACQAPRDALPVACADASSHC